MHRLITEEYRRAQAWMHEAYTYGTASLAYGEKVAELIWQTRADSLLDYGCGRHQNLRHALRNAPNGFPHTMRYQGYDPAIPAFAELPEPADLVCCIDVLEHIEPDLLDNVLDHLAEVTAKHGFFTVSCVAAQKRLPDGRNAHLIQQPAPWWLPKIMQRFQLRTFEGAEIGFAVTVTRKDIP